MKKLVVVVAVMVGLVACGQDKDAPASQPYKSSKVQDAPAGERKELNDILGGGPRSTKIVKPAGEESQPYKSSKVQEAPGGEGKGLNAILGGGPRSTKIVKPEDVKQ